MTFVGLVLYNALMDNCEVSGVQARYTWDGGGTGIGLSYGFSDLSLTWHATDIVRHSLYQVSSAF